MPAKTLADLVKDWGGFEKLVADLSQTGEVTVEHNVVLTGRSGAPRQIDVLIRHKQGLIEHLVVVECKYWSTSVERLHVDALATTVREVGASRGVVISTADFQSGAIEQARHDAIELFRVREPTTEEWGQPGRHIDFYLHILSVALGPLRTEDTFTIDPLRPTSTNLALSLGDGTNESHTPAICDGRPETKTLEELIKVLAHDSAVKVYRAAVMTFEGGGSEGEALVHIEVNYLPKRPVQAHANGGVIFIPKMFLSVGLRISQSRLQFDRAENYTFVLAVEDCVRRAVTAASRREGDNITVLTPLSAEPPASLEEPLQNGSIMSVWLKPLHNFDAFADVPPGKVKMVAKLKEG
jgi:hypothetical protein